MNRLGKKRVSACTTALTLFFIASVVYAGIPADMDKGQQHVQGMAEAGRKMVSHVNTAAKEPPL